MKCAVAAVFVFVASCAGAQSRVRGSQRLDALAISPAARNAQRQAPEAYAAFAVAAREAQAHLHDPPPLAEARIDTAELALEWADAEARAGGARERSRDAERRRAETDADTGRLTAQRAVLEQDLAQRRASAASHATAHAATEHPVEVTPAERAGVAGQVRQETELDLAAARLVGVEDREIQRVQALLDAAAHVGDATAALVAAGRAYREAQGLLAHMRVAASSGAPPPDAEQWMRDLAGTEGFDPHRDDRGVVLVMRDLFGPRGATLRPAAEGRLGTMAAMLRAHPGSSVRVEAYVGGRGDAERTAASQAHAVADRLQRAGIGSGRVEAAGVVRLPNGPRSGDQVEIVVLLPSGT